MTNFRLNLPADIPWKLIDSSSDMMDSAFCDNKSPNPFRSSLAIYAYEPNAEELPEELCGDRIAYLKVSCTITGFQPTEKEKGQIVQLLENASVDYSKIEQIVGEYLGCYGVLLNVSVHPFDDELKSDLDKYPRIVDFEPETRDFYQAATETGEVLTSSAGKVTTNKSFGSTDSTQSSWKASANASIAADDMAQLTGIPVGIGANGETGQVRTDTDQENWSIATDASRERKEQQSTTTQLSQMYNLLTGYHSGSNRATFLMLPRPHILQPTDRRTFVQGLRIIEGGQDFFLVVVRPPGQDKLQVDAHLQTGHFPENITVGEPTDDAKYTSLAFDVPVEDSVDGSGEQTIFGDGYVTKKMSKSFDVVDEANGWEADPTKGDPGHGGVKEIRNSAIVTITEVDTETGQVLSTHEQTVAAESGSISDVEYGISEGNLIVTATLKASRKNLIQSYGITTFSRIYRVFLRRLKTNAPTPTADIGGLLITQRTLCAQIQFGDCITKIPLGLGLPNFGIVAEPPFGIDDLFNIPLGIDVNNLKGSIHPKGPRFDFAFKKAVIRKIQQTMIAAVSSPFRHMPGEVGYLQSRHFQKRLLKVLPAKVLDRPIRELGFVDQEIKDKLNVSLRELLSIPDGASAGEAGISLKESRDLRTKLFRSRLQN
jgi:hypothetical protein